MPNRFFPSFRIAANAKCTPQLTRKVKNCNAPQNKMNSAINWQKSYRLEWYLIIWHYSNLYVYCISFIAKHLLLWKLTGAKSNFESMCLQERNLYHFTVANTRFTAPLTRRGKTKFATIKWYNLCQQIIQSQTCYPLNAALIVGIVPLRHWPWRHNTNAIFPATSTLHLAVIAVALHSYMSSYKHTT